MTMRQKTIQPGWNVYGSDNEKIGDVSEVGSNYLLIRKGWLFTHDIFIPLSSLARTEQDGVYLNVTKDQVEGLGWDQQPAQEATRAATSSDNATYSNASVVSTEQRTNTVETGEAIRVPIVEEELRVGKREVETGGVRVTTRVQEQPVNEQVTLRDEEVRIERRPVDQPASAADFEAIDGATIEMRERDEQAVVQKRARVVEEVVVRKEAEEQTEQIQDTVRRTDVNVEDIPDHRHESHLLGSNAGNTHQVGGTNEDFTERDSDAGQRDPRNTY
jgi:uncharacterized protein (TIGR02271 family)